MKRYEQGSVGMRPDPEGSWCEYEEAQAEIERLREALEFVLEAARWHFDGNADPKNESPEDMTAHINGLIVQRVREALGE